MKKRMPAVGLCLLVLATLAFIWGNSFLSTAQSSAESRRVLELLRPVLEVVVGKGNATNHLVRKLAHFCEFALLGAELGLFLAVLGCNLRHWLYCGLLAGLLAALADETIQLFSGRGSQVKDVWLDFAGVIVGMAVACTIRQLHRRKKRKP